MRVAVGFDHRGVLLRAPVLAAVEEHGDEALDLGVETSDVRVDYPDVAHDVAMAIRSGRAERGVVVCGSGVGASVAASKVPGIRAAICHDTYSARQGVEHDDLNVLCLGARVVGPALARALVDAFLAATFTSEERYLRRVAKIDAIESRFLRDE